jgi:hypothetical protein
MPGAAVGVGSGRLREWQMIRCYMTRMASRCPGDELTASMGVAAKTPPRLIELWRYAPLIRRGAFTLK